MNLKLLIYLVLIFLLFGCGQSIEKTKFITEKEAINTIDKSEIKIQDSLDLINSSKNQSEIIFHKKKVIVVPCYNGYEYIQLGYNFNPLLEQKLKEHNKIEYVPFPLKKMNGSGYQSVYDKKYCDKIVEKTDVDFLIMTKFIGNQLEISTNRKNIEIWGYETKILNVKTMEQKVSIRATNLSNYEAIEKHIENNIEKLVLDLY